MIMLPGMLSLFAGADRGDAAPEGRHLLLEDDSKKS